MQRISGEFLEKIESLVSLKDCTVLEIGCGEGATSVSIASRCRQLTAIDPSIENIKNARERGIGNAKFYIGSAENLDFSDREYDLVIFTLSFHHVPILEMKVAIREAVRVVKKTGYIIFLEPTEEGSFFDAEIMFDACDSDERKEKAAAYEAMHTDDQLKLVDEFEDETIFKAESVNDFIEAMDPRKNLDNLEKFLSDHNYILRAKRRVSIFQLV